VARRGVKEGLIGVATRGGWMFQLWAVTTRARLVTCNRFFFSAQHDIDRFSHFHINLDVMFRKSRLDTQPYVGAFRVGKLKRFEG
jgi:hypothetical protein